MHGDPRETVLRTVDHLAHLLPAQGPIGVFIHHNTLHAFEDLPFEQAVVEGARTFGCEPFMKEAAYQSCLHRGRIQVRDIENVLADEPNAPIIEGRFDRRSLRKAMLVPGVREFDAATILWRLEEGDLAASLRDIGAQELFAVCNARAKQDRASAAGVPEPRPYDNVVHPLLIRLSANFLDQGMAYWPMPEREHGFLHAVRQVLSPSMSMDPFGLEGLAAEFRRQGHLDAADVILAKLDELDVDDHEKFLQAELLALPGWAGMFGQLQVSPDLAPFEMRKASVAEFLAVRLTLMAVAARNAPVELNRSRPDAYAQRLVRVALLFDALAALNVSAAQLVALSPAQLDRLEKEVTSFGPLERRRVFHLAYERRHESGILSPIAQHLRDGRQPQPDERRTAQIFFCIDDREESIRRHLEEVSPLVETFGAPGFFGVAVQFTGLDDSLSSSLCPVVVTPAHAISEYPHPDDEHLHGKRKGRRQLWSKFTHGLHVSSRSLLRGWMSTAVLGTISIFPLFTRVMAPRAAGRLRRWLQAAFLPEPRTALTFERREAVETDNSRALVMGFTPQEKADRVGAMLRTAGLTKNFARLVVIMGHGNTSLNNPHQSAYDCGACGGRRGGPNGRLFALIANHPEARTILRADGLDIPEDTHFIGGYHDTCSDQVELFDLDLLPSTHAKDYELLRGQLNEARARDAQERSRRFEDISHDADPKESLRHVEARAEHLAQPRPEYGHSSNAVCLVGRREFSRGLFLDRRAFLVSYDPTIDHDNSNLTRTLDAIFLVCGGISLEYYFSYIDNEGYGCGSKLPHNVTGLLGVMNGHASDLRTGLTWQMVEIHEPVRILFVLETTPELLEAAVANNPYNSRLMNNRWIRLAAMDPVTGQIHVRRNHGFVPYEPELAPLPEVSSSRDWYQGKLDHLPIARIGRAGKMAGTGSRR